MKTQYPAGTGEQIVNQWLASQGMQPFAYQTQAWQAIQQGASGMVNAPTGCGKTFSVFLGAVIQYINAHPASWQKAKNGGLQLLWISPLRALAKDLGRAMQEALQSLGLPWQVGIRNGDTDTAERSRQKRRMPEVLIITPESLHLLLATREHRNYFTNLRLVAVDEWHELVGSKRGVMTELALAWLQYLSSTRGTLLQVWGISATIGNLEQAAEVLLASSPAPAHLRVMIRANMNKQTAVHTIIPDEIEKYPWAGHLGIKLIEKVLPIIEQSNTTLIFINTRGMAELWYQRLLDVAPQLAGAIALHHGSIEQELRLWVEEALHTQKLKAVVATASLDLGVDFRPVDTVIQVGSPKGVSRFLQRAGRAGHQPGQVSHIYFLPTHSLELVESAALQQAMQLGLMESREPIALCYDVLAQFMCTLACGEGFIADQLLRVAQSTWCFEQLTADDFYEVLHHVTEGGHALKQYDEYRKVEFVEGRYRITSRKLAYRHRLHIGAIVSDAMMRVKFMTGGYVGVIEEWFISRLEPGDVFTLAGRNLELVTIKDMTVVVKKSNAKKSIVPSWMGGRMSLTAKLGMVLRQTIEQAAQMQQTVTPAHAPVELQALRPLFALQQQLSAIPLANQLLIEHHLSKEGYHLVVFPFEGRQVHEAMSALVAWRISQLTPITFSIAMNDYGFELLSDKPIPLDDTNAHELFSLQNLLADIQRSTNHAEMAMRKFRDIAVIGGLIFQGFPGEHKKARHLQSSASLLFKVFKDFDPNNLLLRQAYNEVYEQEMEEARLRQALQRIQDNPIIIKFPERFTPLAFPIIADGLNRNNLSSERLEDRIRKMAEALGSKS